MSRAGKATPAGGGDSPTRWSGASGIVGRMTLSDTRRRVTIDRVTTSHYTATNPKGGTISVGDGSDTAFTPVELLLAAIGGCTAIDVDLVTSRRAEPDSFQVVV